MELSSKNNSCRSGEVLMLKNEGIGSDSRVMVPDETLSLSAGLKEMR